MHLDYDAHATNNVDYDEPFDLMVDKCCTEDARSLEEKNIKGASRIHPLFS